MTLRLGDIAPNFQQESSEGRIDFYEFLDIEFSLVGKLIGNSHFSRCNL